MISKREVANGIYVVTGEHPTGFGVTSTIISSGRQAVVFDTLCYPEDTARLVQSLKSEGLEVRTLVDTHWHADHVAGNDLFNAHTLSQKQCPGLMSTKLVEQVKGTSLAEVKIPLPAETFEKRYEFELGNRHIVLSHTPGHTPDSLVGYLPAERLLIAGDTVMELPFIGYGDSESLIRSLQSILGMDASSIVQGHGEECDSGKVASDLKYLETARKIVGEYMAAEKPKEEISKLSIETFLPAERCEQLQQGYKTWVHEENLTTIFDELRKATTLQAEA